MRPNRAHGLNAYKIKYAVRCSVLARRTPAPLSVRSLRRTIVVTRWRLPSALSCCAFGDGIVRSHLVESSEFHVLAVSRHVHPRHHAVPVEKRFKKKSLAVILAATTATCKVRGGIVLWRAGSHTSGKDVARKISQSSQASMICLFKIEKVTMESTRKLLPLRHPHGSSMLTRTAWHQLCSREQCSANVGV